jgi:hypothetical protein
MTIIVVELVLVVIVVILAVRFFTNGNGGPEGHVRVHDPANLCDGASQHARRTHKWPNPGRVGPPEGTFALVTILHYQVCSGGLDTGKSDRA